MAFSGGIVDDDARLHIIAEYMETDPFPAILHGHGFLLCTYMPTKILYNKSDKKAGKTFEIPCFF